MTADSFIDYLEHPSHLYQISYQELKSLVVQYPYCQNLRYLLLKKSQLENHRDLNRNLALAAAYAADRNRLFELSRQKDHEEADLEFLDLQEIEGLPEKEAVLVENNNFDFIVEEGQDQIIEDVVGLNPETPTLDLFELETPPLAEKPSLELPLMDSFSVFETIQNVPEEDIQQESPKGYLPIYPNSFQVFEWLEKHTVKSAIPMDEIDLEIAAAMERLAAQQNPEESEVVQTDGELEAVVQEEQEALAPLSSPRPEPKVSFSSWLNQFKAPARRGEGKGYDLLLTPLNLESPVEKRKKKKKKKKAKVKNIQTDDALSDMLKTKQKALDKSKKKKKKHKIVARAVMSLVESEDLASETLANILVEQERYKKAIKMYKRLGLKFPEKSAYFAAKIEKIKKLM